MFSLRSFRNRIRTRMPREVTRLNILLLILVVVLAAGAGATEGMLLLDRDFHPTSSGIQAEPPSRIMGRGLMSSGRLASFLLEHNPGADPVKAIRLAALYIEEALAEGVNADVAFVQMCLETGFLRFDGLVAEGMNNFCGLGATGPEQRGLTFPDERTGVRAHIQHLKAYGSSEPLAGELVDPRFHYVTPRGKAPDIYGLAGTWAADRGYGAKLADLLERLYR